MLLVAVDGPATGKRLEVPQVGMRLGRNGVLAADDSISHEHADIMWTSDGSLAIKDVGSTNGTFVNGDRITDVVVLRPGDRIQLGGTILAVRSQSPAPAIAYAGKGGAHLEGGQTASEGGVVAGQVYGDVKTETTVDVSGLSTVLRARGFPRFLIILGVTLALAGFVSFGYPIIRFISEGASTFGEDVQPTFHAAPWLPLGAGLFVAGAICMISGVLASSGRRA